MKNNGFLLVIPVLLVRMVLLRILNKDAFKRCNNYIFLKMCVAKKYLEFSQKVELKILFLFEYKSKKGIHT